MGQFWYLLSILDFWGVNNLKNIRKNPWGTFTISTKKTRLERKNGMRAAGAIIHRCPGGKQKSSKFMQTSSQ